MGLILKNLLSRNALHEDDRSKVQVIGFCFWGWGCLAMRMWENDDGGFMLREEWLRISLTFDETKKTGFSVETTNLLKVLVGYWVSVLA